jgi:hypothetical protein
MSFRRKPESSILNGLDPCFRRDDIFNRYVIPVCRRHPGLPMSFRRKPESSILNGLDPCFRRDDIFNRYVIPVCQRHSGASRNPGVKQ